MTSDATTFALGVADRLDGLPAFRAAPLLWPGILFVVACAFERSRDAKPSRRLGEVLGLVANSCSRLEADAEICKGVGLTSGNNARAIEAAIRDEFAGKPRPRSEITFDLSAILPMGSA